MTAITKPGLWWLLVLVLIAASADAGLASDSGSALYGKNLKVIRIQGAHYTKPSVIMRELASKEGQPYLRENAKKDFARLDRLDIFSEIEIRPKPEQNGVALEIKVKEITPYIPGFTWENTDENGFSFGPGLASPNFLGRDILVSSYARFGGATNINVFFEHPWIFGDHFSVTVDFFIRDRANVLDGFLEKSTEINLGVGHFIGENGRIGARYSYLSLKSDVAGVTLSSNNRDNLSSVGFFLGYDSRDFWSNPHSGWWNELEISKTGGFVGGDGDFWQMNLDLRRYQPLGSRHTLALFSLLTLTSGDLGKEIPIHQDFHIGGTNSVRGWDLDAQRGKNQFLGTAEYRFLLMKPRVFDLWFVSADIGLQLAAFGDLGSAWDYGDQFRAGRFIGGYGFGLRFLMPFINMVRFDFGLGEPGRSLMLHIGTFEKATAQRFRVR